MEGFWRGGRVGGLGGGGGGGGGGGLHSCRIPDFEILTGDICVHLLFCSRSSCYFGGSSTMLLYIFMRCLLYSPKKSVFIIFKGKNAPGYLFVVIYSCNNR